MLACVTGADGFIASHVIARLLGAGFRVRGTVLDVPAAAHLLDLPGAAAGLQLTPAELLRDGAYDSAVAGCDGARGQRGPASTRTCVCACDVTGGWILLRRILAFRT